MANYSRLSFAGSYGIIHQDIDWDSDTIKVALLMANTTALAQNSGIDFVGDYTDLDECDSAGYTRQTLGGCSVTRDDANRRTELDAADPEWLTLPAASRQIVGALVYQHNTSDADSVPIGSIKFDDPVTLDGDTFTIPWDAEGIFHFTFPDPGV